MKGEDFLQTDTNNGTKAEFLWNNFVRLFPGIAARVIHWERGGSKMIKMDVDDGTVLFFIYYTPTNWNLGTKPWRLKPRELEVSEA